MDGKYYMCGMHCEKRHLFQIVFDGGKIAYNAKTLRGDDIYGFQKQLDMVKDSAVQNRKYEQVKKRILSNM